MAPSGKNPDPAWQRHKATIQRLYIVENQKLDDTMCEMRASYGFSASKYQYTTMLKAWGLQKNAKAEIWKSVSGALKRRGLEASEAEVYFHDSHLPLKKLKKELQRYPIQEDALTPTTPEGITILPCADYIPSKPCPIPRNLTISLPWRKLVDSWNWYRNSRTSGQLALPTAPLLQVLSPHLASLFEELHSVNFHGVCSPALWGGVEPPPTGGIAIRDFVMEEIRLGNRMPLELDVRKYFGVGVERSSSSPKVTLEKHLRPYVIEKQPEEIQQATQELMNPYSTASMQILTSYMALLLSNNLISTQAIETFLAKVEETHHLENLIPLFAQSSPSARAIATQLLHAAVRINAPKFLREAFQSGADLESPSTGMDSMTLLQAALNWGKYELARVLINAGADVNAGSSVWDSDYECHDDHVEGITCSCEIRGRNCPISLAAKSSTCVDLIPKLVRRGATIPYRNPVLTHAIRADASVDTISCLMRAGADIQICSRDTGSLAITPFSRRMETPLSAAARNCDLQVIRRLLEAGAHPDGALRLKIQERLPSEHEIIAKLESPLLCAITSRTADQAEELREIVQLLLDSGADPNIPSLDFIYKLQQLREIVQLPLDDGTDLNIPSPDFIYKLEQVAGIEGYGEPLLFYPLQAAARLDNFELVQLLLQNKASPNPEHGISALARAISNSNISIARLLLDRGADPDGVGRGPYSKSALVAAVDGENLELVDLLLGAGADINKRPACFGGRTPLQRAAEIGNTRVIDHLLRHGASVLSPPATVQGISVLNGFVRSGLHDYIARALGAGANPNGGSMHGSSPLAAAVIGGDVVAVNLLLAADADVHEYAYTYDKVAKLFEDGDSHGKIEVDINNMRHMRLSPIQWAAYLNLVEIARILFEAGADVNQLPFDRHGSMALHLAARHGNYAIVQLLLEQKAEVGALSNHETALYAAILNGRDSVLDLLLRNGADPNQPSCRFRGKSDPEPTTPLDTACRSVKISAVRILLANGADISQGYAVWSIFGGSVYSSKRMDVLELLIQAGADVNQRYSKRSTPLQQAILNEDFPCADLLIKAGAQINALASTGRFRRTALQAAAGVGSVDWVERLLLKGADVNAPAANDNGVTALQAAAIKGYLRIAQILLEHNAIIDAPASAKNGRTAIDGAAEFGRIDMVKLLLDNYDGPTPISTLRNSAYQAAKKGNQRFVMELLDAYEHPSEAWSWESWDA